WLRPDPATGPEAAGQGCPRPAPHAELARTALALVPGRNEPPRCSPPGPPGGPRSCARASHSPACRRAVAPGREASPGSPCSDAQAESSRGSGRGPEPRGAASPAARRASRTSEARSRCCTSPGTCQPSSRSYAPLRTSAGPRPPTESCSSSQRSVLHLGATPQRRATTNSSGFGVSYVKSCTEERDARGEAPVKKTFTVTVCNVCQLMDRPVRTYRIKSDDSEVQVVLCEEHSQPLRDPLQLRERPTMRRRRARTLMTLKRIEQAKKAARKDVYNPDSAPHQGIVSPPR